MTPNWKSIFLLVFLAFPHFVKASNLTVLASFNGANGAVPLGKLVQGSDGNFYGTTYHGGSANHGTIFQVTPEGKLTTLVNFDGINGVGPASGLIQASNGTFYGTTSETAFKLTSDSTLTTLYRFIPGAAIQAGLTQGADGDLYGTSYFGGLHESGNIFKLTPEGDLTNLLDFDGSNGNGPNFGGLILASDGNFYGTSEGGGLGRGTIFKLTRDQTLTTVLVFNRANGANPAGLIEGSDGYFYGTTKAGGEYGDGTLFRMTRDGVLTTLINFDGRNGQEPQAGLLEGSDGNFYGTTIRGGSTDLGTVFELARTSDSRFVLKILVDFDSTNGAKPQAGLIQGRDGNLYGTTTSGGAGREGIVFRCEGPAAVPAPFKWTWVVVVAAFALVGCVVAYLLRRRFV